MDPWRIRRILSWSHGGADALGWGSTLRLAVLATVALALASALLLWVWGDRWWPAALLLFGPRWLLVIPVAILLPWTLLRDRGALPALIVGLLVVLGPVMGFRTGWRAWFREPSDRVIRVATFNVAGGDHLLVTAEDLVQDLAADLMAFQECGGRFLESLVRLAGWHSRVQGSLCFLSRYPIRSATTMERESIRRAGGSGLVARYEVEVDGSVVLVSNLHLDTPRAGLAPIREGRVFEGVERLYEKETLREIESRLARRLVDDGAGPHIALGDFNMPVESVIFRRHWGDLRNAFSRAGIGFGATRINGWIRVRIDHVLVTRDWVVLAARTGRSEGSDHRPLVVDLELAR